MRTWSEAARCELVGAAKAETGSIEKCQLRIISQMQGEKKINTVWGYDYASGLTYALRRGARFVTSNPGKINNFRKGLSQCLGRDGQKSKK